MMLGNTLFLSVVVLVGAFCSGAKAAVLGRLEPSLDRVRRQTNENEALMKDFIWTPGVAASVKDGMETSLQAPTPADCAARCVERGRARCLSFEYVRVRKMCLLKKGNSYTVGLRLRLEASSDFYELREELKPQLMKPPKEEEPRPLARAKSEPNRADPNEPEPVKAESGGRRGEGKNRGRGKGRNRGKEETSRQDEESFLRKQGEGDDEQQTTPAPELTTPEKEIRKPAIVPTTMPTPTSNKQPEKEDRKKKGGKKREKGKKRKDGKRKGKGGKGRKRNGKEDNNNNRVAAKFKEAAVVPDVLDNPPMEKAEVKFDDVRVSFGKTLTPTDTKNEPKVTWPAEDGQLYTLAMIDPDSPSRSDPRYGQWKHWLVGNIPGNDVGRGDVISEYISPIPVVATGMHRYVILVYKQTKRLDFDEPRQTSITARGRGLWKVRAFAEKYELGDPVAGNFFEAEWDMWAKKVFDQLATKRKK